MNIHWEAVKDFYQKEFGIDKWVIEMIANMDILSLCVSGVSNITIAQFLELPAGEVIKVLCDTFDCEGWKKDLPINPYRMWKAYDGAKSSVEHFIFFTGELSIELQKYKGEFSDVNPVSLFYMCETYNDIEERINDEWI